MKKRAKRASIFMIFLLVMQSIVTGIAPIQTAYAEGNKNDTFFDFESISDSSFTEEEDGWYLHIDWSLVDYDLEDVSQPVNFASPEVLIEQEGTLSSEGEEVEIASYETTEDVIRVTFNEAALEHSDAEGTLKLQLPLEEEEEVVEGEAIAEESVEEGSTAEEAEEGTEEAVEEEEAEEGTEEAVEEEEAGEGTEEAVEEEEAEEGTEEAVEEEEAEEGTEEAVEEDTPVSAAADVGPQAELGNIFTFESFTFKGEEIEDGDIIDIGDGTGVQVEYAWATDDDAKAGDTASIPLPDVFQQVNISNQPIVTSDVTVGTYSIQDGVLQFVFNEEIEAGNVQNGVLGLNLRFDLEKFQEDIEQVIHFNDSSNKTITVIAKPSGDISGIDKEGHPDREQNAREITWTVDVMNDSDEPITDAVLQDVLPEGLGEPRDFVINELSAGLDGSINVGAEADVSPGVNENEFSISFDNIDPYKGYRVQYTTTIEDYSAEEFTNDATFSYGGTELPADATVFAGNRSNPIEKSGNYNENTGQIDWTINVNESGGVIDEAIVRDNLPEELPLAEGSVEIHKFDSNWSHIETTAADTFPINLGKVEANEIYQITFSTDIDWSKVNKGQFQSLNEFTNQTELYDGNIKVGEDEATVEFERQVLLEKSGNANVDYENKTLSWTIDVNKAKHPINNAVITDVIPKGLTISEGDISITDGNGDPFEPKNIVITPETEGPTEVEIDLGDIGSEHIKITYKTGIEDFNADSFTNAASLNGEGIGEESTEVETPVNVPANSFGKSFEGIDYNEKTMDWQLKVNPIREAITELKITDTFPNQGMYLIEDSLEVTLGGEAFDDYTLAPIDGSYHNGFTITVNEGVELDGGQLEVNYTTSYDPDEVENPHKGYAEDGEGAREYINRAQYTGKTKSGHSFDQTRDANKELIVDAWNSGKKEGQLVHVNSDGELGNGWVSGSERKVAWQLYTNYQKQNLGTGVEITDTLQYDGTIDADSIVVKTYNVAGNGNTSINEEVLNSENYSVSVDGKEFTLKFAEGFEVDDRYVIEFTTSVPDISQPNYTNEATVTVGNNDYSYSGTVNYNRHNHFLEKGPVGLQGTDVFTGEEIDWEVKVNESLSIIEDAVITDTISTGLVYVQDSMEIKTADGSLLDAENDYTLDVTENDDGETVLTIAFTDNVTGILTLNYTTVVTETDGQVNNTVELNGSDVKNESVESSRLDATQFSWVDGNYNPRRGAIQVTKIDSEEDETIANNEATFKLSYDLNGERVQFGEEFTTENGVLNIGNLPLRTYYLEEVESPNGYVLSDEEIEIAVNEPYGTNEIVFEATFENTKEKIDVTGIKEWQGGENHRPDSIKLQLFRNGEAFDNPVTLPDGETEYTWTDLDKTDIDGNTYDYTVDEVNVPENYEKSVSEDGLTVTNEFVSPTTEIPVEKAWDDANNQDGNRPGSVEVALFANDDETEVENITLSDENDWQNAFTDLPELDNSGDKIAYTVKEVNVLEQYESDITGDAKNGFVITNSYSPSKIDIPVEKVWEDANNQDGARPDFIMVRLVVNDEPTQGLLGLVILNESNNWEATFTELDEYQDGKRINYTVVESKVPQKYDSAVSGSAENGYTITNSYSPEMTDITVEKVWEDADNQDGARPDSITVHLYDDRSEVVDTQEITADEAGNWSHVFENLPKYRNGHEIVYRVAEDTVEDYSTAISDSDAGTITVTNEHTPEQTSVTVNKLWNDANNQDGQRPDSIRVQLLADGEALGNEVFVTAADNWSYTWSGLDANRDGGEPIDYTVEEVDVPAGYESEINDENHGAITITNSYEPELINIPVTKEWDDANNQDGNRPKSITLHVINGKSEIVKTAEVTADDNGDWSYVFEGLPKYSEGNEIEYRIVEDAIEGYAATAVKQADGSFIVTNSYTPEQTSLTVMKGWEDGNNQDGVRPGNVTVQLFADGEPVKNPVRLSEENDWTYSWTELDVYHDGGQAIDYTVEETKVPEGYGEPTIKEENGFVLITNNRTPDTVEIPVTKVWDDADNQDGVRPYSVTVNVINDASEIVGTVELNEENDWTHTFKDLPKNRNGKEISYRVTEDSVSEYSTELETGDDGEVTITNAYTPEQTSVTVSKGWDDNNNQDGIRPEQVQVQLYAGEEAIGDTVSLSAANDWMHTWSDLDAYQNGGEEIDYTVKEVSVPEGYEVSVNDMDHGNILLTNQHEPAQTSVNVSKAWDDANNQDGVRPESITVNLLADGEEIDSIELNESNNWQADFTDLDKFKNGELVDYTVEEAAVDGYEAETAGDAEDGYIITNTHEPELIDLEGMKTWDDANDQDGKRPESITVRLLANGEETESIEVSEESDWGYTFTNLPKFENGEEINYTIQEDNVEDYSTEIDGMNITNSYKPGKTSINVIKHWEDANNQDGTRPESIIVKLLADGESTGEEVELSADNNWQADFTDLDEYNDGELIEYTVEEAAVDGYEAETAGNAEDGYVITNTHEPELINVEGTKTWDDNNYTDQRPDSITVNLLADGDEVNSVNVTADMDWTFEFTGLPKFADGTEITYTVEEKPVAGYVTENVKGNAADGFTITNRPAKVSVGDYVWFDENGDGIQDDTDVPLEGVVLTIEDEKGNPVTDVYGNPVEPTKTDKNGYYIFDNLPTDKTYTVRIDREASKEALKGYVPTLEEAGDDNSIDSSSWEATSRHLTEDGDHDPTLDFGFVKEEPGKEPGEEPGKEPGEEPGEEPGKEPGEEPGKEPGEDPGKESVEASGKTDSDDSKGTDDGEALPSTATSMFNLLLISFVLLAAGTILVIVNRFRNRSSNR